MLVSEMGARMITDLLEVDAVGHVIAGEPLPRLLVVHDGEAAEGRARDGHAGLRARRDAEARQLLVPA